MSALAAERERLEANLVANRSRELVLDPVRGRFDAAHLKEVHRRLFQDLPDAGFHDVHPGAFRPAAAGLWMKHRGLETVPGDFPVGYSRMGAAAIARLDQALAAAPPATLAMLDPERFRRAIAGLYAELDYVHPFAEGNSRTLRTFTRQLAAEAGYALELERFAVTPVLRDQLCIARDRSVLAKLAEDLQGQPNLRVAVLAADRLSRNPELAEILVDAVRPLRAVAFERLPREAALARHPELGSAFAALDAFERSMSKTQPDADAAVRSRYLDAARHAVQARLDRGLLPERRIDALVVSSAKGEHIRQLSTRKRRGVER